MRIIVACVFSLLPGPCLATSTPVAPIAVTAASGLSEYGIEGMGVVSTPAEEGRASIDAGGRRIVWAVRGREGGAGGSDLWQATLGDGRWQDPVPLALNTAADEADPAFGPDGRWLYFSSDRDGGEGGFDLHRAAVLEDGGFGAVESLGPAVNGRGDERAPMPGPDGSVLLFAGVGDEGGLDLWLARREGDAFAGPEPLRGTLNTAADERDPVWIDGGAGLLFARADAGAGTSQVWVARCDGTAYREVGPLRLSFNTGSGATSAPAPDRSKPAELLVAGIARAPRAGGTDLYRTVAPRVAGATGCLD